MTAEADAPLRLGVSACLLGEPALSLRLTEMSAIHVCAS